jgi:hypothetical protein
MKLLRVICSVVVVNSQDTKGIIGTEGITDRAGIVDTNDMGWP